MGCDSDSTILNKIQENVRKILYFWFVTTNSLTSNKQSHGLEPHRTKRLLITLAIFSFIDILSQTGFHSPQTLSFHS